MKEIVVISGKGGTGKTSMAAAFALLGGKDVVVADCDVDAADMHLLLEPGFNSPEDFFSGQLAEIGTDKCTQCGKCAEVCRFNAIKTADGIYEVDPLSCEGCGYCARICPEEAIYNHVMLVGEWYTSEIKTGSTMVHAKLGIGADNSGKLVARVKKEAKAVAEKKNKEWILVDGPPGIGCPVISSLSGANYVVLVTEPSVSGLHDLKRVFELVMKFRIKTGCIINKHDINPAMAGEVEAFLLENKIHHLASIPYNENFTRAMTEGRTIVEFPDESLRSLAKECWDAIKTNLNNGRNEDCIYNKRR
jgi:MinD superfamily P-loop ATPase